MAHKFFLICAGMCLLALSFHFGFTTASAQAGSQIVGVTNEGGGSLVVITSNGDVFYEQTTTGNYQSGVLLPSTLRRLGNYWAGGPIPALHQSWGEVKARYRGDPVSTTPSATDR